MYYKAKKFAYINRKHQKKKKFLVINSALIIEKFMLSIKRRI